VPQESKPIQIAQAEGHGPAGGETHAAAGEAHGHEFRLGEIPSPYLLFGNAVCVAIVLVLLARAMKRLQAIPSGIGNFGEYIVESMINFTTGIIGPGGEKYVPLVGTIFFFILSCNLWGQIPGMHSPTANLSTTLALGLIVFLYVQYVGIKSNGLGGYLKHFAGPMPAISPLLFPIELISELVKPFTLAMRLFGNIFGEDTVIVVLATLAVTMMPKPLNHVLPFQLPILILGLLTAFVQAMVFSLLTCIYLSLVSHHDSEHDGQHHAQSHGHPGIEESGLVP
jgi:F-type H+-transporting ATPase subunit a